MSKMSGITLYTTGSSESHYQLIHVQLWTLTLFGTYWTSCTMWERNGNWSGWGCAFLPPTLTPWARSSGVPGELTEQMAERNRSSPDVERSHSCPEISSGRRGEESSRAGGKILRRPRHSHSFRLVHTQTRYPRVMLLGYITVLYMMYVHPFQSRKVLPCHLCQGLVMALRLPPHMTVTHGKY